MAITYSEAPGVPASGSYDAGSFIRNNSVPVYVGIAGARYFVFGWIKRTTGASNTPGTDWGEVRTVYEI